MGGIYGEHPCYWAETGFGKSPAAFRREIAIVDIETTGFDARKHSIIDVAIGIVDIKTMELSSTWESKIALLPGELDAANKESLKIVGYNESEWASAPARGTVMHEAAQRLHGRAIVGHNITFDLAFLDFNFRMLGINGVFDGIELSMVDTMQLARMFLGPLGMTSFSLHNCLQALGLETEGHHRALGGVMACHRLLKHLVDASGSVISKGLIVKEAPKRKSKKKEES